MSLEFLKELKLESLVASQPYVPSNIPGKNPGGVPKKPEGNLFEDTATYNPNFMESIFGDYHQLNKVRTHQICGKNEEKELHLCHYPRRTNSPCTWLGTPMENVVPAALEGLASLVCCLLPQGMTGRLEEIMR